MKIEKIIDNLCSHEITKRDAVEQLKAVMDGLRRNDALEFTVEESGSLSDSNDGYLKLRLPKGYPKMKHARRGDKVDVMILPWKD